jgi:hypothetical protein
MSRKVTLERQVILDQFMTYLSSLDEAQLRTVFLDYQREGYIDTQWVYTESEEGYSPRGKYGA